MTYIINCRVLNKRFRSIVLIILQNVSVATCRGLIKDFHGMRQRSPWFLAENRVAQNNTRRSLFYPMAIVDQTTEL